MCILHQQDWTNAIANSYFIPISAFHPNVPMEPMVWYTVELQMVESRRGYINLLFRGYRYSEVVTKKKNGSNQTRIWRCPRRSRGCAARVTTFGCNQLKVGLHQHNHPPVISKEKSSKTLIPLPEFCSVQQKPDEFKDIIKHEPCNL